MKCKGVSQSDWQEEWEFFSISILRYRFPLAPVTWSPAGQEHNLPLAGNKKAWCVRKPQLFLSIKVQLSALSLSFTWSEVSLAATEEQIRTSLPLLYETPQQDEQKVPCDLTGGKQLK